MHTLEYIQQLSSEAAHKASIEGTEPYLISDWEIEDIAENDDIDHIRNMPFLGDYCPKNWQRVNIPSLNLPDNHGMYKADNNGYGAFMVDSSGFGETGEPALTICELLDRMLLIGTGYGYAIVETGQFQVKIGVYKPKE